MFTLGQAAKTTGLSKTALSRAIKNGRLSATRNEQGEYQIDPAELFRVYPGAVNKVDEPVTPALTGQDDALLREQLVWMKELLSQVKEERDDLRRRLDQSENSREMAATELRRMTLLLTHESKAQPSTPGMTRWLLWAAVFCGMLLAFWLGKEMGFVFHEKA